MIIFYSCSSVQKYFLQSLIHSTSSFKNFCQQFICLTTSVQKLSSAVYPFDCISTKIFFIHASVGPFRFKRNLLMLLAVCISSYGCTWEVWRALKKLELLKVQLRATLMHLLCSPNFPCASITRYTQAKHEQILNYFGEAQSKGFAMLRNLSKLPFFVKIGQGKSVGFRFYSAI